MALITLNFRSRALQIHTALHLILPQEGDWQAGIPRRAYPTLWLLHGLSDDHTVWLRHTAVERYVTGLPLAVVMPAANRSFYQDMAYGAAYWTFVSEELPALLRAWFPLSARREENFAAGLSMGGYGALRLGLTHPGRFAAIGTFSGAVNPVRDEPDAAWMRERLLMFGPPERYPGSDADLFALAEQVAQGPGPRPPIYQYCGRADFLYDGNVDFHQHLAQLGWDTLWTDDDGGHAWDRWDTQIERFLAWLLERGLLPPA
jgi:S-formylglutathione hydrolase FrmB